MDILNSGEEAPSAPESPGAPARRRGADPLSLAHRRKLLKALNVAAERGDVAAAGILVALSRRAEQDRTLAAVLDLLKRTGDL